jgi:tetratricopeptide (TPR) repeat protein
MWRGLLLALAFCFAATAAAAQPPTDYEAELGKIRGEIAALGDVFQGPADLEKVSKYAFLKYRYASLTADFADFAAAESALDEAIRKVGPSEDLLLLKANFDFKLHRLGRTKEDLEKVPDLADSPQARALRADLDFQEGRYAEARKGYEEALRKKRTWDNLARLAYLESKTGNVTAAERLYAEAQDEITAKEMRSYAWVELQRGLLDLDRGRHEEALAHYRRAGRAYSGYWLIEEHIAEVLALLGRPAEAAELYRGIIQRTRNPEFVSALAGLAGRKDPARAAALYAEAERLFEAQSRLYPEAAIGHYLKSLIDRPEIHPKLLEMAERNVALRPNAESKLLLARACLKLGQPARARALVGEILDTPWRTPELARFARQIR